MMLSNSSNSMTVAVRYRRASRKIRLMLRSDPPSHLSRISGVRISRMVAPISLASALASIVLPVPGGPYIRIPCGRRAPHRAITCGWRNETATAGELGGDPQYQGDETPQVRRPGEDGRHGGAKGHRPAGGLRRLPGQGGT